MQSMSHRLIARLGYIVQNCLKNQIGGDFMCTCVFDKGALCTYDFARKIVKSNAIQCNWHLHQH